MNYLFRRLLKVTLCCLSLSFLVTAFAAAPPEIPISKVVPPDFVVNYADYGPIDVPVLLRLNVSTTAKYTMNNDGKATGGTWGGGPTSFTAMADASYVGVHTGMFHGTLTEIQNGDGKGKDDKIPPIDWNGVAKDVAMYIGDAGNVLIPQNTPYAVGSPIALTLNPTAENPTDIVWSVTDGIANYQQSANSGIITPIIPTDLNGNSLSYFYYNGGTKSISVSYKVRGKAGSRSLNLDIQSPSVLLWISETDKMNLTATDTTDRFAFGKRVPVVVPGITYSAQVKMPKLFGGSAVLLQLIKGSAAIRIDPLLKDPTADKDGWKNSRAGWALDTQINYNDPENLAADVVKVISNGDSPGVIISTKTAISFVLKDEFIVYCMYKSTKPGSIPVAFGKIIWGCEGSISRPSIFDAWGPIMGQGATPPNPAGGAYNGLPPTWDLKVGPDFIFVPGP